MFFIFKYLLRNGPSILKRLNTSKFNFIGNLILCIIFSSAMFGGIINLLKFKKILINFLIFCLILLFCYIIFKKGIGSLNKINLILVPLMISIFLIGISMKFELCSFICLDKLRGIAFFYAILYSLLNASNGSILIANLSEKLSKRQKTRVAFISALVLSLILLIADLVLLAHPSSLKEDMPIISLFSGTALIFMNVVVFIGCTTTLFSLIYTSSSIIRGLCKNEYINFSISILLPLFISLIGFSKIVEFLYPLASVLGGALLMLVFFHTS